MQNGLFYRIILDFYKIKISKIDERTKSCKIRNKSYNFFNDLIFKFV